MYWSVLVPSLGPSSACPRRELHTLENYKDSLLERILSRYEEEREAEAVAKVARESTNDMIIQAYRTGVSLQEIADVMGDVSVNALRNRKNRAM